jgi:phage tail sheath protein FI
MTDYLHPGVYIQELEGPAPIIGASTSITGFVGVAERGPENWPILCTGPGDYARWFGGLLDKSRFVDPLDSDRAHCYLPYSVAGFFTNLGQVAYVVRVAPLGALPATETLFDRTGLSTATNPMQTMLARGAAQGDGVLGATPLFTLEPSPPASTATQPSWIRIGDGSASEYAQVANVLSLTAPGAVAGAYPLDQPLQNYHVPGATFAIYARAVAAAAGTYVLSSDTTENSKIIFAQTSGGAALTAAQLTALQAPTTVFELATYDSTTVVIPAKVTQTGANTITITLTNPLTRIFSGATGETFITPLTTPAPPPPATNVLYAAASAGDMVLYANGAGFAVGDLIDIDQGSTASPNPREIRTIAALNTLTTFSFSEPNTVDWPAGTLLEPVTGATNSITAATGTSLTLASRVGIYAGSVLLLGTTPTEYATVASVQAPRAPSGLDPGVVTLTAVPAVAPAAGESAVLVSTATLSSAASASSQQLVLTGRAGIGPGTDLLIGTAPTQERVAVLSAGTGALGPNPGTIVLETPLANSYPAGAPVAIVTFTPPAAVTGAPPTGPRAAMLMYDMPAGSTSGIASSGSETGIPAWGGNWTANTVVQATLPDGTVCYTSLAAAPTAQKLDQVTLALPVQSAHPAGSVVVSRSQLIQIQALDRGAWGNRLVISVQDESPGLVANAAVVASPPGGTQIKLATTTGIQPGSYLEMLFTATSTLVDPSTPLKVAAVDQTTGLITLDPPPPGSPNPQPLSAAQQSAVGSLGTTPICVRSREFRITVSLLQYPSVAVPARNTQVIQTETFRNLSMDPRHNQYFQTIIGPITGPKRLSDNRTHGASWLIRTQDDAATPAAAQLPRLGPEALIDILPNGLQRPAQHNLEGGDDGIGTINDHTYIGQDSADPSGRTGLFALLNVPQISLVAVPGQGSPTIQSAVISHCEGALFRFAVLDTQYPDSAIADVQAQRQQFDTKFAAIYYPWFTIDDPFPINLSNIQDFPLPPSGFITGIYAATDEARGVFKAPANVVVQGITGLTATLDDGDQDVLNPSPTNINVIRDFRRSGRGIRVWGARVMTSDANYNYVPVKRLMMFIEQSLDIGLQDVVFEPNAPPLWRSIERLIGNFLTTVWESGGLQGATADQSFFVRCDMTTMTQDDIDAGRLIAVVGVAPVYPAEFVIIQISLTIPATSS